MGQKEILEGNKLIALFHGWQHKPTYKNAGKGIWDFVEWNKASWDAEAFQYHKSWDWLMPVVEKIEILTYRFTISSTFIRVHTCKKSWDDTDEYHTGVGGGKLNTTWYAVVEFIKWYNIQTAMPENENELKK